MIDDDTPPGRAHAGPGRQRRNDHDALPTEPLGDVTGVVLAGGASSRFEDGNKALATLAGEPLLGRVLDAVRVATDPVPVVTFAEERQRSALSPAIDSPVRIGYDDDRFEGPLAGLMGALGAVETPWLFAVACDMPLVSPEAIAALGDRRTPTADAVVPVSADGQPEPLHAFYRTEAVQGVAETVGAEDGPRVVVANLSDVVEVSAGEDPPDVDLERSTTNVNRRSDLRAIDDDR